MNPWAVESLCTPACATDAAPRVSLGERVRRYASLTCALSRGVSVGGRLAEPGVLRTRARAVLRALGVRLEAGTEPLRVPGCAGGTGTLIVANHISWLDVISLLAVEPVALLAKREVGRWPVIGTLARRSGTRFIDRDRVRELPKVIESLASMLHAGRSVMVFPQATTWCSVSGGRFRRATFQAAVEAGAPVRPVTIDYYQNGTPSTVAGFLGDEDFGASLRRVVGAGGLAARVTAHRPLFGADRRTLAAEARAAVSVSELPAHA
ncbi:lysophospholipid acyltransferase family protein [Streptomyces sp. NPDC004647]|uniref:lysophospholipid acyltransferase family protein n=1 Tax=Streptomyces sp. NPDC004647 TaxID=3154671 RepID=UPI0033A4A4E0